MVTTNDASRSHRPYHSPTRQRQAQETRRRMLGAARALFGRRGYAGTTVDAIAERAGVSPKTVVAAFGSKRGVLGEILDPAGFDSPHQDVLTRLRAEPDPRRRVAVAAELTRLVYQTSPAEFELLRGAGSIAPELADLAREVEQRRRSQTERLIVFLHERGVLRADLSLEAATDEAWALMSFDVYRLLVLQRGWEPLRYETWLAQMLTRHLLQPGQ